MEKNNRTMGEPVTKKKKGKKEKVKQNKEETETKTEMAVKKVPLHVRKMQEELARREEAEQKRKREEEEKRRKQEEEERKQEEILRQKEEERKKKKEKEKEKIKQKKAAGLPLTQKQKEEARRRESMRNQFLAANGHKLVVNENGGLTKPPVNTTKNSKRKTKAVHEKETKEVTVVDQGECLSAEEGGDDEWVGIDGGQSISTDDKGKNGVAEEESDDDEWDAKSWDDGSFDLAVKQSFDDEDQDDMVSQLLIKKQVKQAVQSAAPSKIEASGCKENDSVSQTEVQKENLSSNMNLRSPICCIMGHVDAGKTKLLDCIRGTNVQGGEAGGITQQIGATYFPAGKIKERTKDLKEDAKLNVPGLLVIDTPGHECFTNLRSRGSGLCDIAILVVDITDGLKPQTIESIELLEMRNTEFIVALNKVDRLYGWKTCQNAPIRKALKQQTKDVQNEFKDKLKKIIVQFQEQCLNTELYYRNKEMGETFSIVPTSAVSGEGIPDLLLMLVKWSERRMVEKLTFNDKVQCTVLEVKVVEGHGTTIDVVLINGVLHEGDQIVVGGIKEAIVTTVRTLLTPHPMKELRVKGTYLHHKEIKASQGIKIAAQGLEHAVAGAGLYVVGPGDDIEKLKKLAMEHELVLSKIDLSAEGVCVQASSDGSAQALSYFLNSQDIAVRYINKGPVHKKDVNQAIVMLKKRKEYATILAFDVEVTAEAREYADGVGVKIFTADVIYHLLNQFKAYINEIKEKKKREAADDAVFPCILKILPFHIYHQKAPILVGVKVCRGIVKVGTPIFIPSKKNLDIGRVTSIQFNGKPVDLAKEGQEVTVKIVGSTTEDQRIEYGRHFNSNDRLVSHISRKSIDAFDAVYKDDESIRGIRDLLSKLEKCLRIY